MNIAKDTAASFNRAYPDDTIVVYTFKNGGTQSYYGEQLLNAMMATGEWLRIFKLTNSGGEHVSSDEIKTKAFPFIYETRHHTDSTQRRNILRDKLMTLFPDHHVNVSVFDDSNWARQGNNMRGAVYFEKDYGTEVDIVLN